MYIGLRPVFNVSPANTNQYRDWHRLTLLTDNLVDVSAKADSRFSIDNTVSIYATNVNVKTTRSQESSVQYVFPSEVDTVDTLQLQAHGINIYQQYKGSFFRDYQSYTFGGANIVTPEDKGAYMMNFCLYPGTYQPSGHINVSRAREFYIQFTSSYCSANTPCELIVLAKAINFLLISDGSAVLRYST